MSEAEWTFMQNGLDAASVRRGVTTGIARPPNGGGFVYGFNSVVNTLGAVALYANQLSFAPIGAKGGSIRGAVQRGASGGPLNFAPFLYLGATALDINVATAYMLGLDDDDPHRIVLRKGKLTDGLPSTSVGTNGILAAGTETFVNSTWVHLRLDAIVNTNGDVLLQAYRSDLTAHNVDNPAWVLVPGIGQFIDDALGINSGSPPLQGGYIGFGFQTKDVSRRSFFDQIEVQRQL
jgi:hypothetical protein